MDKLTRINVFVSVAETGSFSVASERLGISRAAVSKYVSQLEAQLGGRLLNRTTRRVSTTESGRIYFERCKEILQNLKEADDIVTGLSGRPRGTLRISAPTNFASRHLMPLINEFTRAWPEVQVELMCSERMVDLVDEGYDLAIRMTHIEDSELIARRLSRCRHVLVASPDYLQKNPVPKLPDELAQHACILYAYLKGGVWPFTRNGRDYRVKVKPVLKSNNPDVLLEAAMSGMGVSLLPTFVVCDAVQSGALRMLLEDFDSIEMDIYAVYASRHHLPAKIRVFVDYLKKRIIDPPSWDQFLSARD